MNNNKYFSSIFSPILIEGLLLIHANYISGIEDKQQNATLAFGDCHFIDMREFHRNEGSIRDHFEINEA
jgi:hypothetical protein